ncbi:MAG: hypothetical protein HYU24_01150 [Candidatus Rokubacteria bacterium]|nr:hypothetical protein [Candidatus Rokubacteria bacterium]
MLRLSGIAGAILLSLLLPHLLSPYYLIVLSGALAFAQMVHALFISGTIFQPFGGVGKGLFLEGGGGLYIPRLTIARIEFSPEAFTTVLYYIILFSS